MAVILAESVAITKSRLAKGFNGDNLNLNGKVITAEEADKGFKAAGSVKPPYISVIASGNQKGFSAGAANAFNDYVKDINFNKYNSEAVFNRFFDDMDAVVEKCGIENGRLSMGIVCAYDDCVVAAKTGGCHLLRFSEGELFEIALSEDENGRGFQFVDCVADGDIFALIGEEVSQNLDYDAIVNVFDSGNELKVMVRDFFKLLASNGGKDCSVILVKLKSDTERTYAAVPDVSFTDDIVDDSEDIPSEPSEFDVQPAIDETELKENEDEVSDEEIPETGKSPSAKKKILGFIPVAVLVIILAVTTALYFSTHPRSNKTNEDDSQVNQAVINVENKTNEGDDFNGSNGMQEMEDTEHGGNVAGMPDDNNNNTAQQADTTAATPVTTTRAPEPTQAPETTTQSEETTTAENTETTTAENTENTTAENTENTENTTVAPEPTPEPIPDEGNNDQGSADEGVEA